MYGYKYYKYQSFLLSQMQQQQFIHSKQLFILVTPLQIFILAL
jgi:hypothetical protein